MNILILLLRIYFVGYTLSLPIIIKVTDLVFGIHKYQSGVSILCLHVAGSDFLFQAFIFSCKRKLFLHVTLKCNL